LIGNLPNSNKVWCQKKFSWEIQIQENNIEQFEEKYVIRSLENEFVIDFNSVATNIHVFDLSGRRITSSLQNHSSFYIAKSNSPRIIQFTMNGLSHRILLGVE
jgi:hypothetical protein